MVAVVTAVAFGIRESVMSNKHAQSVAADQAAELRHQAAEAERQFNLANRKKPNLFGITASNRSPIAGWDHADRPARRTDSCNAG